MIQTRSAAILVSAILVASLFALWVILLRVGNVPEVDFKQVSTSTEQEPHGEDHRPVLRVAIGAMISPSITKHYYEDLMKVIGDKVGMHTTIIQRKTYAEVNALIKAKGVDLAFVCSGPYVQGHAEFGMEIAAVPVVDGGSIYFSYILAGRDSRIRSFDDLKGKRFAFTDPDSNTGCLVPRFIISKRGEAPDTFFKETFFTHGHDNSIEAVSEGLADGAAVDSLIWDFLKATDPDSVARTVVIHKSPPYGIPPLVFHPDLDPSIKAKLRAALLSLHEDPQARSLMQKVRIEKFEKGSDSLYDTVREMQVWLSNSK
ncbi:MAG: phosphate/phosphite/phosphonate ABC transporter substrate-binding protein [bacterium]